MEYKKNVIGEIAKINKNSYNQKLNWNEVYYLDTGNITENIIDELKFFDLKKEKLPSRAKRIPSQNSIVYSTVRPNQKHYGFMEKSYDNLLVSTGFAVIDVNTKIANPRYVFYFLIQDHITDYLQKIAEDSVSTYPAIRSSDLEELEINIPSIDFQDKVVNILFSLDKKIELNNKIISNLEAQAQAIFKSWFIDFEPFQDGEFVESELGLIPEGWKVKKLGEIIELLDYKRIPISKIDRDKMDKNYPYYGANGIIDFVEDYLFDGKYLLLGEDGTVKTLEGYPVLNYVQGKFWVSNHAHILKGKNVSTEFIYVSLKKRNVTNMITGAVQEKINQSNLKSINMIIADKETQDKFERIIHYKLEHILLLQEQNQTLAQLRDTLLPKLMSGEIDVSSISV
ncbi:MAG: restriction endonuclease subunit S [Saccharofermentanales bacterium]|jgi:type I restriction enzyme S subunit